MSRIEDLAQRRDVLVARAELDRIELRFALQQWRGSIVPGVRAAASQPSRYAILLRVLLPLIGLMRFRRAVAMLSAGFAIARAVRAWRGSRS